MRKAIRVRNLEYVYPEGTKALKGIDLDIFQGESVGLIGPNGAGKSTLVLHLNGILKGGMGSVEVLEMKVEKKNLTKIRQRVALVFQEPDDQLFMPTVMDDVAFGPINAGYAQEKVRGKVRKALRDVEMEGYEKRCPHHLSFGEKRRIALATVLSMEPEILILDEPSSNLDPGARRHLIELLKNLNLTKIISGHDLELILETCPRVIILDDGQVVTSGETRKVLSNKLLLESHSLEVPLSLKPCHLPHR